MEERESRCETARRRCRFWLPFARTALHYTLHIIFIYTLTLHSSHAHSLVPVLLQCTAYIYLSSFFFVLFLWLRHKNVECIRTGYEVQCNKACRYCIALLHEFKKKEHYSTILHNTSRSISRDRESERERERLSGNKRARCIENALNTIHSFVSNYLGECTTIRWGQ